MSTFRIALANIQYPATPEESIALAEQAIAQASTERADLICFPECFVPGYRGMGKLVPPPDTVFLERAWSGIASAAAKANVAVILGTERIIDGAPRITALVINRDGTMAGFQDKVQLDPSRRQTGDSQPIPKTGIGGSPRFAAHARRYTAALYAARTRASSACASRWMACRWSSPAKLSA